MAKKEEKLEVAVEEVVEKTEEKTGVLPIDQEFGNGDLNILRDKINEIITKRYING